MLKTLLTFVSSAGHLIDFAFFVLFLVSPNLIALAMLKWGTKHINKYKTQYCRDVRGALGIFAYKSDLERNRKRLETQNKF